MKSLKSSELPLQWRGSAGRREAELMLWKGSREFFRPRSSSLGNDERWDRGGMLHHSIVPMGESREREVGMEERNGILFAVRRERGEGERARAKLFHTKVATVI